MAAEALPLTMRAWRLHRYGGADALVLDTLPLPRPGAGELLLRVRAASINPIDWKLREGWLRDVVPMALPITLGRDCVGEVVAMGEGVVGVALGDRVLALAAHGRDGTHAEFCVVTASQAAPVPAAVADADAVCLGVAGLSALIPLVEIATVGAGTTVLVHAGAGGVGGLAVQIAKRRGARVIATCSARNADYVKQLGADQVVDYAAGSLDAVAGAFDVALDSVGGDTHARTLAASRAGGLIVTLAAAPLPAASRADVRVVPARIVATTERLARLLAWVDAGTLRPQVDARFGFADLAHAYERSRLGPVRGKLIIQVRSPAAA